MAVIDPSSIEKFQALLKKDPNSQAFAPLAEAYREMKMLPEAEKIVRDGMKRHPNFVSGLVTFAKILRDQKRYAEALPAAKKATQLASENLLAHQLCGELHLALNQPKDALKSFKMVLFLNPQSPIAKKAIQKLESLTADEYEDEVFEMGRIHPLQAENQEEEIFISSSENANKATSVTAKALSPATTTSNARALERMLSLIDAFIVRHDLDKAHLLLRDSQVEFGDHPEIERRLQSLKARHAAPAEEAIPLKPLPPATSRERARNDQKLHLLNRVLDKIEDYRGQHPSF